MVDNNRNTRPQKKNGNPAWRIQIDSDTVDLRKLNQQRQASRKYKNEKDKLNEFRKKTPVNNEDNFDAVQYLKELKQKKYISDGTYNKLTRKTFPQNGRERITKEDVLRELYELDEEDMRIKNRLASSRAPAEQQPPKQEDSVSKQDESAVEKQTQPEEEKPTQKNHTDGDINLIPDAPLYGAKRKEKPQRSEKKEKRKKDKKPKEAKKTHKKAAIGAPERSKNKIFLVLILTLILVSGSFMYLKFNSLRGTAKERAQNAYNHMQEGREALSKLQSEKALEEFKQAENEFKAIENKIQVFGLNTAGLASVFPFASKYKSSAHMLSAGEKYALAGKKASLALSSVQSASTDKDSESAGLTYKLLKAEGQLQDIKKLLTQAGTEMSHVQHEHIPENFREKFVSFQEKSSYVEKNINRVLGSLDVALQFLGHREKKSYVMALQNSSELRATGGFIGSYGIVSLNNGSIGEFFVDGVYNPDGQLSEKIVPPKPLQYVTPTWGIRDANWFFDFPTSAEKIMSLYKKAGGQQTDGIIAVTPDVVIDMLKLTGPVKFPEYSTTITADNFLDVTRQYIENNKRSESPKQILKDFAPIFLEKIQNTEKQRALQALLENLKEKEILVYSRDGKVQEFIKEQGWGGAIKNMDRPGEINDYLAVVVSNLGGWKTDRYTDTEVDTTTKINYKGEVIRTVVMSRHNKGNTLPYHWYNTRNSGYMRFYVPKGSELISSEGFSEGFVEKKANYNSSEYTRDPNVRAVKNTKWEHESGTEVFEESGRTVFGDWLMVEPGERKFVQIKYKLPYKVNSEKDAYNLILQKQSGLSVKYSGLVKESYEGLNVKRCKLNNSPIEDRRFNFVHKRDTTLKCNLEENITR